MGMLAPEFHLFLVTIRYLSPKCSFEYVILGGLLYQSLVRDILLVNPQGNYPHPPPVFGSIGQGPAYIAGILKQKGHATGLMNESEKH